MLYANDYSPAAKKFGVFIGWLIGIPLLLIALITLFVGHSWLGELCFFACAAVAIPPARVFLQQKIRLKLSIKQTAVVIAVLLISGMVLESTAGQKFDRESGAREYADKRDEIIELMKGNIEKKQYQAALDAGEPYLPYADTEFKKFLDRARSEKQALDKKILSEDFSENRIELLAKLQGYLDNKDYKTASVMAEKYEAVADSDFLKLSEVAQAGYTAAQEEEKLEAQRKAAYVQSAEFVKQLDGEIKNLKEPIKLNNIDTDIGVIATVAIFNNYAKLLQQANNLKFDADQKKSVSNFRDLLIKRQKEALPKLRKAYGKYWHQKLWQEDCEAVTIGNDNRIIEFRGNMFLPNKHKQEFIDKLNQSFNILRFSQVRFRWFKQHDEYTYYKMEGRKDGEIGIWNEYGSFTEVK